MSRQVPLKEKQLCAHLLTKTGQNVIYLMPF